MKQLRSECCEQPVRTEGIPDFMGDDTIVTVNYFCTGCEKPCNTIEIDYQIELEN